MLVRYNPFRALQRREDALPSLWDHDFFADFFNGFSDLRMEEPKIEMKENKKNYLIRGEFPGYGKDEVKAEIVDGVLRLHAEHKEEKWDQDEDEGWRSIETRSGSYTRSFALPEDMDVKVSLYDVSGRHIMNLASGRYAAGSHSVTVNSEALKSGIYIVSLRAGSQVVTKKVAVIH